MENLILYQSPYPKKRLGKYNDGGYVISLLPGEYDALLSGGIGNDISFERHLIHLYPNLKCNAFDGTIVPFLKHFKNITFHRKNLANYNSDSTTNLLEYMKDYKDIFLKMDIEGHEFRILPVILDSGYISKVKQLVIEIHSPGDIRLYPDYFKGLSDIDDTQMFSLFKRLNETHTLVHFHANNGCKMQVVEGINLPHVFELTYIRNDFVSEKIKNTEPLPTPLDMKNIADKPDYSFTSYPYVNV